MALTDTDRNGLIPWVIFLTVLLVYLCFPNKVYFFDGIAFAQTIEDARGLETSLIHPNHLFYEAFGYLIYRVVRGVGIEARALIVLQITNSFLSAGAAVLFFHILRRTLRSVYLAGALTFLFAFSATWWKFSTDADAYIPSVLFVLVSFYLILPEAKPRPLLVALTFSLSMCMHQLAVVFFPVLVAGLFLQSAATERRRQILTVLQFSSAAFVITFGVYYYCFYLATGTLDFKRLMRWMTSFSPDASFSFNAWSNLSYTVRGYFRLFFGGRLSALKGLLNPFIIALIIGLVILAGLFVARLIRGGLSFRRRSSPDAVPRFRLVVLFPRIKLLLFLCSLWIAVYTVFLFVWLPQHTFYRLFYLPALLLLAGILISSSEALDAHKRTYRLALFVAVMSLANFLFLIFPSSYTHKYQPLAFALEMNQVWPRGTVVYYSLTNSDESLFRYFNPQTEWRQWKSNDPKDLENDLRNIYDSGGTAWLEVTAIEQLPPTMEGADWLAIHAREETRRELVNKAYKIKFLQIVP